MNLPRDDGTCFATLLDALRRQPAFQRMGFHRTRDARGLDAIPEQDQAGDAFDVVAHRHLRMGFGIDLGEAHTRAHLGGHLLEHRRHHLAGAAPAGPEIDQYRQSSLGDEAVERVGGEIHGFARQQGRAALTAFGPVGQPIVRHAVDGEAVGAGKFHRESLKRMIFASRWGAMPEILACSGKRRAQARVSSGTSSPAASSADVSSKPPTKKTPMKTCGTVRRPPVRVIISSCLVGSRSMRIFSISVTPRLFSSRSAATQYGQTAVQYMTSLAM